MREKLLELRTLGAAGLRAMVDRAESETAQGASGQEYTVAVSAFWDTVPNDSDLFVEVAVSPGGSVLGRPRRASLLVQAYSDEMPQAP